MSSGQSKTGQLSAPPAVNALPLQLIGPRVNQSEFIHCLKKHPRHFRLQLEKQLSDFNNFWYEYS